MTTRRERLERAMAFDEGEALAYAGEWITAPRSGAHRRRHVRAEFVPGVHWEHARLAPFRELLLEAVESAEYVANANSGGFERRMQRLESFLERVDKVLSR